MAPAPPSARRASTETKEGQADTLGELNGARGGHKSTEERRDAARDGVETQSRRLFPPAPRLPPPRVVTVRRIMASEALRTCHADTTQLL